MEQQLVTERVANPSLSRQVTNDLVQSLDVSVRANQKQRFTKNEILEMYANTVYYGRGAYGLRVAALTYFNKEPMKLSTSECAYLVGLFKAPERYGTDDSLGVVRRNLILGMMHDAEYLTDDEWTSAVAEPLRKAPPSRTYRGIAPHFVEMVRQTLTND
ncbi:MAG: transglycosylase domain-containing protein, partial [bacterium]